MAHDHPTYTVIDPAGDYAFEVVARDLEGLVSSAVLAVVDSMFGPDPELRPEDEVDVVIEPADREMTIFRALSEVVCLIGARGLIPCGVEVDGGAGGLTLRLWCDRLDPSRHRARRSFKAATLHGLAVTAAPQGLRARIVMEPQACQGGGSPVRG